MGPCVESCMKSGALSPNLRDGDGRISTWGPARRSAGAVPARMASKFLDFSAPYSCWDNIAVHRPSMQIPCTNVWLSCPPCPSSKIRRTKFAGPICVRYVTENPTSRRFVGQTPTNCGVMPYRQTGYNPAMCRSIKKLRRSDGQAGDEEVRSAPHHFLRKVSRYRT